MKVRVQTAQNVEIEYEVASLGDRILSTLIDGLIMGGYIAGVILIMSLLELEPSISVIVILFLPILFYHLACEITLDGQSFGKKQMQIKVVKLDGSQPTIGSYILRWVLRPVDTWFYGAIAMLTIVINGKGQRLGDIAAGTTVVRIKPQVTLDDTILTQVAEDYVPVYTQALRLSDRDIAIIKDVLDLAEREANYEMLDRLAEKVRSVMEVESNGMFSSEFLRVVLKDYNALTAEM